MKGNPFLTKMDRYDDWYRKNKNLFISEMLSIKEVIHPFPVKKSLEIGCGTGRFSSVLNIDFSLDISEEFYLNFKKRFKYFITGSGEKLPFKGDYFYFVFLITTLCFLKDVESSISEIRRVLKKDSFLIVSILNRESKLGRYLLEKTEDSTFYKNFNLFTPEEVIEIMKKFNFQFEKSTQTIFDIETKGIIYPVKNGHDEGGFVSMLFKKN